MYRTLLLPALGALALALAASPGHAATDMNADWQAYEQAYGSNAPPAPTRTAPDTRPTSCATSA